MKKRVLSLLLTLALCFTMLPAAAFAAEADPAGQETQSDSGTGEVQTAGEKNGTAVQAGETHTNHPICGDASCNEHGESFSDWQGVSTLTAEMEAGHYYLTDYVTINSTWKPQDGVVLCLNGYGITLDDDGPVIEVQPGVTFTLCDCNGSRNGGSITHKNRNNRVGGGVLVGALDSVGNSAVFNMYGGTISANETTWDGDVEGSGVTVAGGTFNMYGGKISDNKAISGKGPGGGVFIASHGTFNMSGGEITGNEARVGGGVFVGGYYGKDSEQKENDDNYGGTFNMSGGSITGNTAGGGVYVNYFSAATFKVSGTVEITGNTNNDKTVNNVYLSQGTIGSNKTNAAPIVVNGTLDSTASIGVTTAEVGQTVATGVSAAAKKCFTSDNSNYRLKYDSSASTLTMIAVTEHAAHPICGDASCTDSSHALPDGKSWVPVSDLSKITADGYYYLTDDVTISSTWEPKDGVVLCLNGYSITADGNFDTITVGEGVTFTLCDCYGGGEITHAEGKSGTGVYVAGADVKYATFTMYGGTITGNAGHTVNTSTRGGGVYVDGYARFRMSGGSITGNTAAQGGGVYYVAFNSLYVSGKVNITGNKGTDDKANNVYVRPARGATPPTVTFYIGSDGLDASAQIGVWVDDDVIATGAHSPVAQMLSSANGYNEGNFLSDNGGDYSFKMESREYDSYTPNVVNLYNGLHEHPLCGKTHKDIGDHKGDCPNVTWTAWDGVSDITYDDNYTAYVYLTTNAERNTTLEIAKGNKLYLCLNGHSLTMNKSGVAVIKVVSGATLSLCDCSDAQTGKLTHGTNDSGSTYSGRGVTVEGTFNMYGGSITGNSGGVYVESAAAMTVSGNATITGNAGNNANYNVYLNGVITVGGKLSENAKIGVTTYGTNISAGNYKTVAKSADGSALTDDDLKYFESDKGYKGQIRDGKIVFVNGVLHEHPLCGKTCEHAGDGKHTDDLLWTPLTYENGYLYAGGSTVWTTGNSWDTVYYQLTEGNYYLPESITIDKPIMIRGDVNLCLNGNTLSTNTALPTDDSIIAFFTVYENCTLTLCDCGTGGTIRTDNNLHYGVNTWYPFDSDNTSHTAGNFTMYGGTITGVQRGVRLCVETNGGKSTFKMYGGKITGTKRGVYVNDGSIFEMYGGEITGNDTEPTLVEDKTYFGGGVVVDIGATFTMKGGTISNNNAYSGGGVCLLGDSSSATTTFTMEGGTITGNTTTGGGGGGVYLGTNTAFNMSGDAAVSGNTIGGSCGGGVYVPTNSSFAMSGDATVSGNSAKYGGGVYVAGGTFNMSKNAAISGNNAGNGDYTGEGGGVCVVTGTFNMTGGSITGNNVHLGSNAPEGEGGGGVYVAPNATAMNVSGDVQIHDNWKNGTLNAETGVYKQDNGSANNLYLFAHKDDSVLKTVTIDGVLESTARIGVTTRYTPTASDPVKFATGATEDQAYYTAIFTPDDQTKGYMITQKDETLYLSTHQHSWSYTANGATITATCEDTDCTSRGGGSVTIKAPDKSTLTYDGNAKKATLDNKLTTGVTEPTIYYSMAGEPGGDLAAGSYPTVVGSYTASITVGGATASVPYEIAKGEPTLTLPTVEATYEQHLKDVEIVNPQGNPEGTWTWENGETYLNSVGEKTYNAIFTPKDSSNYLTVTKSLTVTVNPKQYTDGIRLKEEYDYTYNGKQKTPSFFTSGMQSGRDYTWAYGENINAGENAGSVTVSPLNGGYYTFEPITVYFNILPKGITVSGITAEDKYYDGSDAAKLDYTNVKLDGKLDKDDLSITAKGAFEDADAGENKTVEISDLTLTGAAAGNYILVDGKQQTSTTATINQMPLTITGATAEGRDYRKSDMSVTVTGVTFADNGDKAVTLMLGTDYTVSGTMDSADAGIIKDVAVKVTLSDSTAKNYSLDSDTIHVKVTINRMKIAIPTADATKFTYTGSDQTYTLTGLTEGYCSISGNVRSAAGDHTVIVSLTDKDNTEWTDGKQDDITFTFHIEKADGAVTAPTGKTDLRYAGEALELLETPAATDFGTVEYKLDGGDWSAEMPTATNAGEYTVYYRSTGDGNHNATNGTDHITVQIAQAKTTGEPKYTPITSAGKTLEDAHLTLVDSTLDPVVGSLIWIDEDGNALGNDTEVEANKAYGWKFTPSNTNYAPLTGEIVPYRVYYTPSYPVNVPEETGHGAVTSSVERAFWGNTVTITVKPNSGYVLETLTVTDQNGKELELTDKGDGTYTFTMPSGEVTIKATFMEDNSILNFFIDVPNDAYYYEAVKWAVENGITNGVGYNLFAPGRPCTRAQIVTFLWRAAGSPEPKSMTSFSDVPAGSYYAKAVAWAVENGIALGVSADRFAPDDTCTRAHAVTFLARALNGKAEGKAEFVDVPENGYYAGAVAWASENGVTEGIGMGKFGPNSDCTRGQIVTFLYRAYNK